MAFFARPQSRSAAVKIVAPSVQIQQEDSGSRQGSKKDSIQRQCRNILIHGFCKFEGKGCVYYHPPRSDAGTPASPELQESTSQPSATVALSAEAVNAPVFVPKLSSPPMPRAQTPRIEIPPSTIPVENEYTEPQDDYNYGYYDMNVGMDTLSQTMDALSTGPGAYNMATEPQMLMHADYTDPNLLGGYYQSQPSYIQQPLNYHLYTHPIPVNTGPKLFITDTVREELLQRAEAVHTGPPPGLLLPEELQGYHTLVPIEPIGADRRKFGSWHSTVYKAINSTNGVTCVLRRVENFRLMHEVAFGAIETWSRIQHPGIISVKEAFTTRAFNDSSLVVVYDYHPNAQTLFEAHMKPRPPVFQHGRLLVQQSPERISERLLWSYITQIGSAIKAVHDAGLAVRIVDVTKVLLTGHNRVRISSCGLFDVLLYDTRQDINMMQQEDLMMFARLIITLCCNSMTAMNNLPKSLDMIGRQYSVDVKNVVLYLLPKPGPMRSIPQMFDAMGNKISMEVDELNLAVDRLEGELMTELENGRLVRLLCKFGFINERPEFDRDPRWSETGDRYIIKLFRDYVFHQVDESGNPVTNLSHVLKCLNKLDAGTDERIMLVSRDEQSCLVVSYKEIRSCVEAAFSDLSRGSR